WLPSATRPGADRRSRRQRIPSRHSQSVFSSALSSQPPDSLDHTRPTAPDLFMLRFSRPAAATTCRSLRPDSRRQQYQACRVLSYLTLTSTFFGLASSRLPNVTRRIPSLNSALTLFVSTKPGSVKLRVNSP